MDLQDDYEDREDLGEEDLEDLQAPPGTVRHDAHLAPSDPALMPLAAAIFDHLEATFPRPAKQRSDARDRRLAVVENLVASLTVLIQFHPDGTALSVAREGERGSNHRRPVHSEKVLFQMVSEMHEAGYLEWTKGIRRRQTTRIVPTSTFRSLLPVLGVAPVKLLPGADPIVLKVYNADRTAKTAVQYRDTPDSRKLRRETDRINEMLAGADIRFDGKRLPPQRLVRIFLADRADAPDALRRHGRIYHGFWQDLPKADRYRLAIDGEPCCDLDFRSLHLNLIYARQGVPLPGGDPYAVPEMAGHRAGVKKAIASLFHREGGAIRRLSPALAALLPDGMSANRLMDILRAHHPPLANLGGKPQGETLTYIESLIMVRVLRSLSDRGVVALPAHDGLLVARSHRETAIVAMQEVSRDVVGVALPVTETDLRPVFAGIYNAGISVG